VESNPPLKGKKALAIRRGGYSTHSNAKNAMALVALGSSQPSIGRKGVGGPTKSRLNQKGQLPKRKIA